MERERNRSVSGGGKAGGQIEREKQETTQKCAHFEPTRQITGIRLRLDARMLPLRGDQVEAMREGLLEFLERRPSGATEPLVSLLLNALPEKKRGECGVM